MTRRIEKVSDYITAGEACQMLSQKLGREISNKYIRRLATRAKNPIRSRPSGNRWLYHRGDIENATVKQKGPNTETSEGKADE